MKEKPMYITGANGLTRFVVRHNPGIQRVLLAGSFTHWKLIPMKRLGDGSFSATVMLPAGAHEYKFVIDGMWCTDPDNYLSVPNPHGSENSLALVLQVSQQDSKLAGALHRWWVASLISPANRLAPARPKETRS